MTLAVVVGASLVPPTTFDERSSPPSPPSSGLDVRAIVASDPGESGAVVGPTARTARRGEGDGED